MTKETKRLKTPKPSAEEAAEQLEISLAAGGNAEGHTPLGRV